MNSKMPKGVEHLWMSLRQKLTVEVMNSKMPKGVEHLDGCLSSGGFDCDEFEDAERR